MICPLYVKWKYAFVNSSAVRRGNNKPTYQLTGPGFLDGIFQSHDPGIRIQVGTLSMLHFVCLLSCDIASRLNFARSLLVHGITLEDGNCKTPLEISKDLKLSQSYKFHFLTGK